ncbi:hypothetical protein ACOME3_000486 [Neoechinorhynchus agilis]
MVQLLSHANKRYPAILTPLKDSLLSTFLTRASVELAAGGHVCFHLGGLPSGWKWTALIDTVLNYSLNRAAIDIVGLPLQPSIMAHMGDDSLWFVKTDNLTTAIQVRSFLNWKGYTLNASKNYISNVSSDFLGYTSTSALSIRGAPSWMIPTIVTSHSRIGYEIPPVLRAFSALWNWVMVIKRLEGIVAKKVMIPLLLKDVSGISKRSTIDVIHYLNTPISLGVAGLTGLSTYLGFESANKAITLLREPEYYDLSKLITKTTPLSLCLPRIHAKLFETAMNQYCERTLSTRKAANLYFQRVGSVKIRRSKCPSISQLLPARWSLCWSRAIESTLKELTTRSRSVFRLLSFRTKTLYVLFNKRRHSWALIRSWLLGRLPTVRKFVFIHRA